MPVKLPSKLMLPINACDFGLTPQLSEKDTLLKYIPFHIHLLKRKGVYYLTLPVEYHNVSQIREVFERNAFLNRPKGLRTCKFSRGMHVFTDFRPGKDHPSILSDRFYISKHVPYVFFRFDMMSPGGPVMKYLGTRLQGQSVDPKISCLFHPFRAFLSWLEDPQQLLDGEELYPTEEWECLVRNKEPGLLTYPKRTSTQEERFEYLWDRAHLYSRPIFSSVIGTHGSKFRGNRYAEFVAWFVEHQILPFDVHRITYCLTRKQLPYYLSYAWLPWFSPRALKEYTDLWSLPKDFRNAENLVIPKEDRRKQLRTTKQVNALERIYEEADREEFMFMKPQPQYCRK